MVRRFSLFVEGLIQLANKHGLAGELIVVEWNPPSGLRLHEVIHLRTTSKDFIIRYIEVPPEAHDRFRNADVIPLFQYIAKNVGIRRARGEFVIATNPDLLFSDDLMALLASSKPRANVLYRLDRTDVEADAPLDAPVEHQLAWCEDHILRVHTKYGSFPGAYIRLKWWNPNRLLKRGAKKDWLKFIVRRGRMLTTQCVSGIKRACDGALALPSVVGLACFHAFRQMRAGDFTSTIRRTVLWMNRCIHKVVRRGRKKISFVFRIRSVLASIFSGLGKLLDPRVRVHTNGCGDFTMLSKQSWLSLRGYPELPIWSMHLDSLLCYMAIASGLRETVLDLPHAIYHLEHGNSWVVMDLDHRLKTFGIKPWLDQGLLNQMWKEMYLSGRPVQYNDDNWGLGDLQLTEVVIRDGQRYVTKLASLDSPMDMDNLWTQRATKKVLS